MGNEKKQVVIEVRDKIARLADETLKLVCGNSDYEVIFDFDGDWGVDTEKTAYFVYNYDTVPVIFKGNKVDGVAIHMASLLSIGVSEGDIKTTTPAEIPMLECITDRVGKCINIPESLYNQLMVHINELYKKSQNLEVRVGRLERHTTATIYDNTLIVDGADAIDGVVILPQNSAFVDGGNLIFKY